ncbi:LexA family transcriptional repressor [Sesbania bispinosa]|nr:LexA family transcriptional repressor [Sesbania bispinosa]
MWLLGSDYHLTTAKDKGRSSEKNLKKYVGHLQDQSTAEGVIPQLSELRALWNEG